jgi:formylglycine-generating enzyme required for sulfatase activity
VSEEVIKIFYSYSRKDLDMRNTLEDHLSALREASKISTWHDLELEAGTEWEPVILNKLNTADIILLLVSRNFIASKYCYGTELKRAIARHHEGTARVIPIILRPCDWNHSDVPFSKLNVLPTHAKAITSWLDPEEAFTIVAQKIRATVDQLRAEKVGKRQAEAEARQAEARQAEARQAEARQAEARQAEARQQVAQKEAEQQAEQERIQREQQSQKRTESFTEKLGNNVVLEMVAIPGGRFLMGSAKRSNEQPVHEVKVAPFFLGKYPVTQAQWKAVAALPKAKLDLSPDPANFKGGNRPVEMVSWLEAMDFCDRLSRKTKKTYRLPSEAEWEYACRAGTTTPFHFGETITTDLANFNRKYKSTTEVSKFQPNAFGLYDMHGNVWEWCADHWHGNYQGAPIDGSAWLTDNKDARRLVRGGSWGLFPGSCRSAYRNYINLDLRYSNLGFRVVCVLA